MQCEQLFSITEIFIILYYNINISCVVQAFARIENHYFINKGFFSSDSFLLDNVEKIKHIKTTIVQVNSAFISTFCFALLSHSSKLPCYVKANLETQNIPTMYFLSIFG